MVRMVYIETKTPEEAVRVARQLAAAAEMSEDSAGGRRLERSPALFPVPESVAAGDSGVAEDELLTLEEVVASDLVPMQRVPKTGKTVRSWIREGRLPKPAEGFGLGAKWFRSAFKAS